jgi:hypothetical protein
MKQYAHTVLYNLSSMRINLCYLIFTRLRPLLIAKRQVRAGLHCEFFLICWKILHCETQNCVVVIVNVILLRRLIKYTNTLYQCTEYSLSRGKKTVIYIFHDGNWRHNTSDKNHTPHLYCAWDMAKYRALIELYISSCCLCTGLGLGP